MQECTDRDPRPLEWKEGESELDAWNKWVEQFDTTGDKYLDMGSDQYFFAGYESRQPEIDALKAEVAHWKANHASMVNRSRVLIDRTDLPLERVKAFEQLETLKAENEKLRIHAENAPLLIEENKELNNENEKLRKAAREVINLTSTIRGRGCGILALEAAVGYLSDAMTAPDTNEDRS